MVCRFVNGFVFCQFVVVLQKIVLWEKLSRRMNGGGQEKCGGKLTSIGGLGGRKFSMGERMLYGEVEMCRAIGS